MENIIKFDEFLNEELTKKQLIGLGLLAGTGVAAYNLYDFGIKRGTAEFDKIINIGGQDFKEYDLLTQWENFNLRIKDNVIVSKHTYTEGSGDDKKTYTKTNIIFPKEVKEFYYDSYFFKGFFASNKPFTNSKKVSVSDLKVIHRAPTYTIYTSSKFLSPFDYVIVTNGHDKGEEYKLSDGKSLATYVCDKINKKIYVFCLKSLGGGDFGGGGAGGEY